MELKASKVISALEFLQNLAINPLQSVSSKNKSVLNEIRKSYFPKNTKSTTGKKRKQPPSKSIAPKPKRQRLSRSAKVRRSAKEEHEDDDNDNGPDANQEDEAEEDEDDDDSDAIEEVTDIEDNNHIHGASLIEEHASKRNITGDSPSHFTYFGEDQGVFVADKEDLSPLWSQANPQHNDLDNYLQSVSKLFYHPIEAMDQHLNLPKQTQNKNANNSAKTQTSRSKINKKKNEAEDESQEKILRYSTINLLLSPLRKRSPFDEWCPREIALFESAMCCKGKQFHEISKIVQTKNTKECVEFYYFWKQSSHYTIWKALGRKTKKQLSRTQKKLHKRIGDRFAEFHSTIYKKKKKQKPQSQMMQRDINTHYTQNTNNNNNNNSNNNAMLVQQQAQPATMGIIGYYPQYIGNGYGPNGYCPQNGYQWYHNNNIYNQYQTYNQSQQPQTPNNNNGSSTNNGTSMNTISPDGNDENADFIDLTETASSSNGDNSGSSKEPSSDHDIKVKKNNNNDIASLKKHNQKDIENTQDINQSVTT